MNKDSVFEAMTASDGEKVKAYLEGAEFDDTSISDCAQPSVNEELGVEAEEGGDALNKQSKRVEIVIEDIHTPDNTSDTQDENKEKEKAINEQRIGKFKNPQELLKAYGELEKEFTRRSQRLKELESGKKVPMSDEAWKGAVDKFFKEIPSAKAFAKDIANEIIKNPTLREDENCLGVALMRVLTDRFRTPEQLMEDGQFLNDYVFSSEKVRDAIIANYLDGVRQGVPPYTLHGGGMQCVAPKVKPKTIEEAGAMFLKNNK